MNPTAEQLQIALGVCQQQRNEAQDKVIDACVQLAQANARIAKLEAEVKALTPAESIPPTQP